MEIGRPEVMTDEKLLHILLPHGERLPVILILILVLLKEGRKEEWALQCGFSLLS